MILTHGHADHYGMAHLFPWAGCSWAVGDLFKTVDLPAHMRSYEVAVRRLMPFWGVPPKLAEHPRFLRAPGGAGGSVAWAEPIDEGSRLEGFGPPIEVIETPGHTEGLVCLFRAADHVLLSSDQLLETIIPNPGLYALDDPPGNGLADYIASVRRLAPLAVRLVLPGHGRPFDGFRSASGRFWRRRTTAGGDAAALGEAGVYELARKLFPDRDWSNSYFAFIALLEAQGRLGAPEERGRAGSRVGEGEVFCPGRDWRGTHSERRRRDARVPTR